MAEQKRKRFIDLGYGDRYNKMYFVDKHTGEITIGRYQGAQPRLRSEKDTLFFKFPNNPFDGSFLIDIGDWYKVVVEKCGKKITPSSVEAKEISDKIKSKNN